jgi:hypothetical protein
MAWTIRQTGRPLPADRRAPCVRARIKAILQQRNAADGSGRHSAFVGTSERRNTQQEVRLQRICLAGVCLALIFAGGEAQAADAKAPPMTASQKAAVDRAYAILQDTRDLQAMERLERRVPDQYRRGRRPRHF